MAALVLLTAFAAVAADTWKYVPTFHGTMRTIYEQSTVTGESHFAVANARLLAGGYVLPGLDYLVQVDFCAKGKIKLFDAFMRYRLAEGLDIYAGQMRVPFSVGSSRFPHLYYFTDVGLVALFGNLRSVGVKAGYAMPRTGLYVEGGIFNASDMTDHDVWNSALTYSVKASYKYRGFTPEVGFQSRRTGDKGTGCRINQIDATLTWRCGSFMAEGEAIRRYYCGPLPASSAYSIMADYGWPVKWRLANRLSVQSRYEGITDASKGVYVDGVLPIDMPARRRLTIGASTSKRYNNLMLDFKINYQQYFYHHGVKAKAGDNSKIIVGAMMHF